MVVGDERQGEVDAGGDARGGPDVAVPDVDGVGVDGDTRVAVVEQLACGPVRGRPTTLQQPGGGEDEGARAHGGDPAGVGREPPYVVQELLVRARGVHAGAAGDHQRVDGADDVLIGEDANSRPQLALTGPPPVVTTSVRYAADSTKREAVENTSRGPVTSRICAASKVTMTTRGALIGVPSAHRRP